MAGCRIHSPPGSLVLLRHRQRGFGLPISPNLSQGITYFPERGVILDRFQYGKDEVLIPSGLFSDIFQSLRDGAVISLTS